MSSLRDTMRAQIFKDQAFKREKINIFGVDVEIKQPTLGQILASQDEPDRKKRVIGFMIGYCYIPDTDELVFEPADYDAIVSKPFGDDLMKVNEAIEKMTNINVAGAKKELGETQGGTTSS